MQAVTGYKGLRNRKGEGAIYMNGEAPPLASGFEGRKDRHRACQSCRALAVAATAALLLAAVIASAAAAACFLGGSATAGAIGRPAFSRTRASMLSAMSTFSRRNAFEAARPWPRRSSL